MDFTMYAFMGLPFPSRYYFSLAVMLCLCGFLFLIKKPSIQFGVAIFLLCVHFIVAVSNIILYRELGEIASIESLTAVRQVTSLGAFIVLDFDFMFCFSVILLVFIGIGSWALSFMKRSRREGRPFTERIPYRRNAFFGIAAIALAAYASGIFYNFTLPYMRTSTDSAFDNYTNEQFIYSTFSNRVRMFSDFGTYSYYWANIAYVLGLKTNFSFDIPDNWVGSTFHEALPDNKQNVIMLQMETLERSLVNPIVMPNLYNFLYNTDKDSSTAYTTANGTSTTAHNVADIQGYYAVDRTCITEYAALAGTHLDGVEMPSMPDIVAPYSLPYILSRTQYDSASNTMTPYESIKAFHDYYSFMYNRDTLYPVGLGFQDSVFLEDMIKDTNVYEKPSNVNDKTEEWANSEFNQNSDYRMFESEIEQMAPSDQKFFSYIINISTHMPYYDANLFDFYKDSGAQITGQLDALKDLYANLSSGSTRTVNAVLSELTGAYEYDRGLGVLFNYLETTPALDSDGNIMQENGNELHLIDTTTIMFYADHHDYSASDLLDPVIPDDAAPGYYLTESGAQGNELAFYIYSPPLITHPTVIKKFVTHYDIYATMCDLLHIKINTKYTLGISVFRPEENIGFSIYTGMVFNNSFATYDFKSYLPHSDVPDTETAAEAKARASYIIAVMNNLRPLYRGNLLRDIPETFYTIDTDDTA